MTGFTVLWAGQVLSSVGTRMTNFALGIWLWQQTHRASDLALLTLVAYGATVLCSPLAGSVVDRLERRWTLVISDLGSAVSTAAALALFVWGTPSLWQLLVVNALTGGFLAFQLPAYAAAITAMTAKKHYTRANGMLTLARSLPAIFAPALAAALLAVFSIGSILLVDALSYLVAVGTVFLVAFPAAPAAAPGGPPERRAWLAGFRYIGHRPGLIGLRAILFMIGLIAAISYIVLTPMVLARTGDDEAQLGAILSIGAIGGVVGGVAVGALPSPRRVMPWLLLGVLGFSVVGRLPLGVPQAPLLWSLAWFASWLAVPFMESYSQSILQRKVPPAVQGRVFAATQMIDNLAIPLGFGLAGPLADDLFEPGMAEGGDLVPVFGWLVGTGPGAGMAVIFVLSGLVGVLTAVAGWVIRPIRELEDDLPDHDEPEPEVSPAGTAAGQPEEDDMEQEPARFRVVVNDEPRYALWPLHKRDAPGWRDTGVSGTREECLAYVDQVWSADLRTSS
jgi:MFS transporter, DHA3 family, macrolide efflux protein